MAMPQRPPRGRPSVFRDKRAGHRVQAIITKVGKAKFFEARQRLAELTGWRATALSQADVVEFLARGESDTRAYLEKSR